MNYSKPPLGIIPEKLWLEQRIQDLSEAVLRYVKDGLFISTSVETWIEEIQHHTVRHKELTSTKLVIEKDKISP